jgi:hypothetical protein
MKRNAGMECISTKRIILGVQRLSLRTVKRSPSPLSPPSSMEIVCGSIRANGELSSDSEDQNHSHSSSQDSDMDWDNTRRARSSSEPRTRRRIRREIDDHMSEGQRGRTWSLPRIVQLQEEARTTVAGVVTTVFPRRSRSRLSRRASDPPRFVNLRTDGGPDAGYTGGCECDSDMEDQVFCTNCKRDFEASV